MDAAAPQSVTLATLTTDYLRLYAARRHSAEWQDNETRVLRKVVLPRFGHLAAEAVTPLDARLLIAGIVEEGKLAKVNHTAIAARAVYRWAFKTGRIVCANPFRDVEREPIPARDRVLTELELRLLWQVAPEVGEFGRILRLLILTGARRQEIGSLVWTEINREARQIELPPQRVKNPRPFVLH